jgi:IS5 family transposase
MNRRRRRQLAFHDFPGGFSGARIFSDNRWVKLAQIIPWDLVDKKYAENFVGRRTGNPAVESRIAFGALIIKQELNLSDEDTVAMIQENPHCQYFLGMSEFTDQTPFDASKLVAFRKRFTPEAMAEINEAIITAERENLPPPPSSSNDDSKPADNTGTLILDATCTPADVHFPTDAGVLNDARELSEKIIDELCVDDDNQKKPRTYRRLARKNYLVLVRNKRPGYSLIRRTLRAQLQYLRRNLGHIQDLTITNGLTAKQQYKLDVLTEVYRQQKQMYDNNRHAIEKRIVSVSQPWVRPIVRGKLTAKTEFGAKLALSLENGFARVEKLSWDAFNESQTLIESCKRYRERNGVYPERILADKIYRNRDNLNFCNQNGIKMNGPKLGRPPKDKSLYEYQKLMERSEAGERNAIEGKFGEAKRRYGLDRVMARLSDTSNTAIHLTVLVMNLKKRLRDLFDFIFHLLDCFSSAGLFFKLVVEQ